MKIKTHKKYKCVPFYLLKQAAAKKISEATGLNKLINYRRRGRVGGVGR